MPTSTGFHQHQQHVQGSQPVANLPVAYFDANGQPTVYNKMSTVGTASATSCTASVGGCTFTASCSGGDGNGDDGETLPDRDEEEEVLSLDTSIQSIIADSETMDMDEQEMMRDRMSDDGTASLVGFGEGANSTVSGPIYQRRPVPAAAINWGLERTGSGLSEGAVVAARMREQRDLGTVGGPETPLSNATNYVSGYTRNAPAAAAAAATAGMADATTGAEGQNSRNHRNRHYNHQYDQNGDEENEGDSTPGYYETANGGRDTSHHNSTTAHVTRPIPPVTFAAIANGHHQRVAGGSMEGAEILDIVGGGGGVPRTGGGK